MLILGARGATGYVLGRGASGAAANWWEAGGATNCVAAYQPIGAASLAASYINLASPGTYDCTVGVAPTWSAATGWTFGSGKYLKSGVVPAAGWTVIIRYSNFAVNANKFIAGEFTSGASLLFGRGASIGFDYWNGGGQLIAGAEAPAAAVVAVAGQTAYRNGSAESGTIPAWTGTTTTDIWIGGYNNGVLSGSVDVTIQALAIYSAILSAATVASVTAAMQAL